jgi:hypothetical protein
MKREILQFIYNQPKNLEGLCETEIFVLGGHLIGNLQEVENNELIAQLLELEIKEYLNVVTTTEIIFKDKPPQTRRFYRLTRKGLNELKPFIPRTLSRIWQWILKDGYVIISIIALILSIISFFISSAN